MADGGETTIDVTTGEYRDRNGVPTGERTVPHTRKSVVKRNAKGQLIVEAAAAPEYSRVLSEAAKKYAKDNNIPESEHQKALNEAVDGLEFYKGTGANTGRLQAIYNSIQGGGQSTYSGNVVGQTLSEMGTVAAKEAAGMAAGGAIGKYIIGPVVSKAAPYVAPYFGKLADKVKGIYFRYRNPPKPTTPSPAPAAPSAPASPQAGAVVGEPVSVANGEYLETWRDFLVPGTYPFDGARYMGLKLALPQDYLSPLGPCQISMFDEVFSNPSPGKLCFHDSDGKTIQFDRPFNFLPSINPGYPHLELKAPWLRELRLKDRAVTKHFRQYDDDVYRLEKIEDLNGFALDFIRDEDGNLQRCDGPDGMALVFENDRKGHRTRILLIGTDSAELELARYAYDSKGRMSQADCVFGMSVSYQWQEGADLLNSWHNSTRASETFFTYDENGRVVHTKTNGIWNDDRFDYREGETAYLPGGKATAAQRFQYDEHENITAEIDALGGIVAHRYDGNGFRTATTDPNGHASATRYDIWGNVKEFTDAEGRSTIYGWGDYGELDIVIDGAGNRKTYEHDTRANVVSETDAEGHVTRLSRDDKGRVIETQFANGATERRSWDDFNRLTSVTDAKGHVTRFEYDSFNRLIAATDALGGVTQRSYAAAAGGFDVATSVTRPDGVTVTRAFDGQGQLSTVRDGEGRTWRYRNGAFGVLEEISDPKGGTLSFGYDSEGRILSVTNALGRVYRFTRDAAGRVSEEEDFDGRVKRYRRDAAGQVVETMKPDGARLAYGYDKSGLLRRIESFAADGKAEDTTRFWYDQRGLLVQAENKAALIEIERDRNGRINEECLNGKRVKSGRDSTGARILREILHADGSDLVRLIRDPLGAVEKLTAGAAEFGFARDALGRETQRSGKAFALDQRFDAAGQLTAQSAGGVKRAYEYDRAFAPVRINDSLWGETRLAYDGNGQLASADGAAGTERFTYDAARNVAGASAPAPRAGYGGASYRASALEGWQSTPGGVVKIARGPKGERIRLLHDECGRLVERHVERDGFRAKVWTYGWDALDRLVSCEFIGANSEKERWVFAYDPFGRRVSKVRQLSGKALDEARLRWPEPQGRTDTPAVGTSFLWDGDQLAAEAPLHLGGRIDWARAVKWHYADEGGFTPIAKELPDGSMLHIVSDHLGTPKEMFDAKGELVWAADHHVWGAVRAVRTQGALALKPSHDPQPAELHCPWRFPGQYEDAETGLYYNRHRHYDPLTGQYASPDPIGLAGGHRPAGYVTNPARFTDPLGLAATVSGRPLNPVNSTLFHGGDAASLGAPAGSPQQIASHIYQNGLPTRGTNWDLLSHARGGGNSAFRGGTEMLSTPGGQGAAYWAGEGGIVVKVRNVKGWDVNKALEGRVQTPGGYKGAPFSELETAFPAGVSPSSIEAVGVVRTLPSGKLFVDWLPRN